MLRSAVWYCASVAEPLRVSVPVLAFQLPLMPFWLVKLSVSWPFA